MKKERKKISKDADVVAGCLLSVIMGVCILCIGISETELTLLVIGVLLVGIPCYIFRKALMKILRESVFKNPGEEKV